MVKLYFSLTSDGFRNQEQFLHEQIGDETLDEEDVFTSYVLHYNILIESFRNCYQLLRSVLLWLFSNNELIGRLILKQLCYLEMVL